MAETIFRGSVIINRPIMEIFNYVADAESNAEWYPFYTDIELEPRRPNSLLSFRAIFALRPFIASGPSISVDMIDYVPGRRLTYRVLDVGTTIEVEFQPAVRGTLVSVTQSLWGWQAAVFGLVAQPVRLVANDWIMQVLNSLKQRAEARRVAIHPLIFFNYRRSQEYVAGRIYDALCQDFGLGYVFKDFDSIKAGNIWREGIDGALKDCKVIVAHIEDGWEDEIRERIGKTDWVRDELERALAIGETVTLIPVFTSGDRYFNMQDRLQRIQAALPDSLKIKAALDNHQGLLLRTDPDFRYDLERLILAIWENVQSKIAI
jgi:hypothetical protein